jgi:hypothetical protein
MEHKSSLSCPSDNATGPNTYTPRYFKYSLPFRFITKNYYAFILSLVHAICRVHLILLDFYVPNNIWRSIQIMKLVFMSFLYPPVTSWLLDSNVLLSIVFSNTLPSGLETKIHTHIKQRVELIAYILDLTLMRNQNLYSIILHKQVRQSKKGIISIRNHNCIS